MSQSHLVPQIVIDCAEKMLDERNNYNVRDNYQQRLEAIRKFCESALNQNNSKKRR
jgi:metal-responsive CopG/Arc/MetJ family transcriptional regulator